MTKQPNTQDLIDEGLRFTNIQRLVYVNREQRFLTEDEAINIQCDCRTQFKFGEICVDERCINYSSRTECPLGTCSKKRCANKRFQKQQWKQVAVIRTEHKGNGLKANEFIPAGSFVIEYIGEVVDAREYMKRMEQYRLEKRRHFYLLQLRKDEYIDACRMGNIARFMNHSCEPNCRTEVWHVGQEERVGIFALRDIAEGEELCFDYQWQRLGEERIKCYCGAPSCRGYLGAKEDDRHGLPAGRFRPPNELERSKQSFLVDKFVRVFWEGDKVKQQTNEKPCDTHKSDSVSSDVFLPTSDGVWYAARVCEYDESKKRHKLIYLLDQEVSWEDLTTEKWEILVTHHLGATESSFVEDSGHKEHKLEETTEEQSAQAVNNRAEYQQQLLEEQQVADESAVQRRKQAEDDMRELQMTWTKKLQEELTRQQQLNHLIEQQAQAMAFSNQPNEGYEPENETQSLQVQAQAEQRRRMEMFLKRNQQSDTAATSVANSTEQATTTAPDSFWGEISNHTTETPTPKQQMKRSRPTMSAESAKSKSKRVRIDGSKTLFNERDEAAMYKLANKPAGGVVFPYHVNWRFPLSKVLISPSMHDGISRDAEKHWRVQLSMLILRTCVQANLHFSVACRALLMAHRLCSVHSILGLSLKSVAGACIMLAYKTVNRRGGFSMPEWKESPFEDFPISQMENVSPQSLAECLNNTQSLCSSSVMEQTQSVFSNWSNATLAQDSFKTADSLNNFDTHTDSCTNGLTTNTITTEELSAKIAHTEMMLLTALRFDTAIPDFSTIVEELVVSLFVPVFRSENKDSKLKIHQAKFAADMLSSSMALDKHLKWYLEQSALPTKLEDATKSSGLQSHAIRLFRLLGAHILHALVHRSTAWALHMPEAVCATISFSLINAMPNWHSAVQFPDKYVFKCQALPSLGSCEKSEQYPGCIPGTHATDDDLLSCSAVVTRDDITYLSLFVAAEDGVPETVSKALEIVLQASHLDDNQQSAYETMLTTRRDLYRKTLSTENASDTISTLDEQDLLLSEYAKLHKDNGKEMASNWTCKYTAYNSSLAFRTTNDFEFVGQIAGACFVGIDHGHQLDPSHPRYKAPRLVLLKRWPEREDVESNNFVSGKSFDIHALRELSLFQLLHTPWFSTATRPASDSLTQQPLTSDSLLSINSGDPTTSVSQKNIELSSNPLHRGFGVPTHFRTARHIVLPTEIVLGNDCVDAVQQAKGQESTTNLNFVRFSSNVSKVEDQAIGSSIDISSAQELRKHTYLVLEYCPHNLAGLTLAGMRLEPGAQQRFARQLLRAVRRMHACGIIHHHINSAHIFFTPSGCVQLYGLADASTMHPKFADYTNRLIGKAVHEPERHKKLRDALGYTPGVTVGKKIGTGYLCRPPESLLGGSLYLPSADMWSVGCVIAEACMGRPVFYGATIRELLNSVSSRCGDISTMWPASKFLPEAKSFTTTSSSSSTLKQYLIRKQMPEQQAKTLSHLLQIHPTYRLTAEQALKMSYFKTFTPKKSRKMMRIPTEQRIDPAVIAKVLKISRSEIRETAAEIQGFSSWEAAAPFHEFLLSYPARSYEMQLRKMRLKGVDVQGRAFWQGVLSHCEHLKMISTQGHEQKS